MSIFSQVRAKSPSANKFDLSHERKMSLQMGGLYPILVNPILPGDNFKVHSEIFMRLAPMLAPVMHRINVFTHYFFVPNRIVWNEWESFITGGKDGDEAPTHPYIEMNNGTRTKYDIKSLADYMGLPTMVQTDGSSSMNTRVSALPFRSYQQIYNDYFRDQNLTEEIDFSLASGRVDPGLELDKIMEKRQRCWPKDYFTSALPWSQRGPEVTIPSETQYKSQAVALDLNGDPLSLIGDVSNTAEGDLFTNNYSGIGIDNIESIGITINDLRRSSRLQEWLEKNARGGGRYLEQLLSHWGVISDDARLQRAEYLGGGKTPISISEVLQTGATGTDTTITSTPQGHMAGHGIAASNMNGFKRKFKEHGYVIGLMSVLPTTAYQDGLERHFTRFDKLAYPWPEFANLGEQEIKNKEIFLDKNSGDGVTNEATFGYQSRYAEEKYGKSSVHGDFRNSLDYWHMGRRFGAVPPLNEDFVNSDPTKRIFAVETDEEDELYCQVYNSISAVRKLPYFGTPRL